MTPPPKGSAWTELRREWRLLTACTIGFGMSLSGTPFYTMGVFIDPLKAAFGWSVGAIQLGLTISYLTTVAVLPGIGWLTDRFGVRIVALSALTLMGLAFMALGLQAGQLWTYYLTWFFISLFGTGTLAITWSRAITGAFRAARGLALGVSLLGTGLVGVVAPPAARSLIDLVGWRGAYFCLGAPPILIAVPVTLLFLRDAGPRRQTQPKGTGARLNDPRLWTLAAAFLLIAGGIAGVIPNLVKVLTTEGLSRADAVAAASVVGGFVVLGRVGCGALVDRFWAPGVAAAFVMMPACACAVLAGGAIHHLQGAMLAAALIGLAAGAEFDLLPFLVGRYLPPERYTAALALASAAFYLGAAAGGPALATFYDRMGSYRIGLGGAAALFAVGAAALLTLGPYPVFTAVEAPRASSKGPK